MHCKKILSTCLMLRLSLNHVGKKRKKAERRKKTSKLVPQSISRSQLLQMFSILRAEEEGGASIHVSVLTVVQNLFYKNQFISPNMLERGIRMTWIITW